MHERDIIGELNRLADELFSPQAPRFADLPHPPFDLSREARHSSKSEFDAELKIATNFLKHLNGILDGLRDASEKEPDAFARTQIAVNKAIRNETRRRKVRDGSSRDLAIQNIREVGFFESSRDVLEDMRLAYDAVVKELKTQKVMYWSARNRPPDHYARIIALRFARLYERQTGKTPTYGVSSQGNYPSTEYGRALEKVFKILSIETKLRFPAVWALDQFEKELLSRRPVSLGLRPEDLARARAAVTKPSDLKES